MKTANKCPKCGKPILCQSNISKTFECQTFQLKEGNVLAQSDLCRERVKVAKLKKKVEIGRKLSSQLWLEAQ